MVWGRGTGAGLLEYCDQSAITFSCETESSMLAFSLMLGECGISFQALHVALVFSRLL